MISTSQLFAQFGGGREGWWKEDVWRAVLGVLAKHENEAYTPSANSQLFKDLEQALSSIGSDMSAAGEDEARSVFRAAPGAWVETGVVRFDQTIQVTDDGHAVLAGDRSYSDCLRAMFVRYLERRNRKNPFRPILHLLSDGQTHQFQEVFDGVQRECGSDMDDWIRSSRLQGFPYKVEPNPANPTRSVRFLMQLLAHAGLVSGDQASGWQASDLEAVRELRDAADASGGAASADAAVPAASFDTEPIIDEISRRGWQFTPWQVVAFCHAVKTKPFVVLAGISGTGKTKLPRLVAAATGARYCVIPVRPDWRDSSDLLGYTDLAGSFHPGPLLRAAKAAIEEPERQHFVLLDEMNLARVEYYFAEVLSLIEERHPDGSGGYRTDPMLAQSVAVPEEDNEAGTPWHEVYLPSNLALIGSVNMDETTHPFSRKVLDRAFVIEFSDVDLSAVSEQAGAVERVADVGAEGWRPEAIRLAEHPLAGSSVVRGVIDELVQVNEILQATQLQVGYRLRDEVALFVLSLLSDSNLTDQSGGKVDPVDLSLCMKILPRVQGGGPKTRALLSALAEWAGPADQPRLPICLARVELLIDRFDSEGFTSFWL